MESDLLSYLPCSIVLSSYLASRYLSLSSKPSIMSKEKYTQSISKLTQGTGRMKEKIVGRLLGCWKEDLPGGKSKIMACVLDGKTFQDVLVAEAWSLADQTYAQNTLPPLCGQVVAMENAKIASKGKSVVFHSKQLKMSFDRQTKVEKLPDDGNTQENSLS